MKKKLIEIGSIVEDASIPNNIIGGGVSYSGIAAKELGYDVQIITQLPPHHQFIKNFQQKNIDIILASDDIQSATVFTNTYDTYGKRTQTVSGYQGEITQENILALDHNLLQNSVFLVAPVMQEVETEVISLLAKYGMVAVTPQGYFRKISATGEVHYQKWEDFEEDLRNATVVIFSDEDIASGGHLNKDLLEKIRRYTPIAVLTQGENGSTVFYKGKKLSIKAFQLHNHEINDFTGAGDVFAAAFLTRYVDTKDLHEAAVFASLYAALKIVKPGKGVETVPSVENVKTFIAENPHQIEQFKKVNHFNKNFF